MNLVSIYVSTSRFQEAKETVDRVLKIDPDNEKAQRVLTELSRETDR
jgi:Tfp pilus assembly protein PilF